MQSVLIVIHILIVVSLIVVVLLQRSEGGALGAGGGTGSFMTGRGQANALSRATGKNVEVKVIIDESVLGGIVATIGDTVIDGTVRHRLDQLKEQI